MGRVKWRDAAAKINDLIGRLPLEFRASGLTGLAKFVAASLKVGAGERGVSAETIRTDLSNCQADTNETSDISPRNIARIMAAFGLGEEERSWFEDGDRWVFAAAMNNAAARATRTLRLRSLQPRDVWNDELRSDVSAVQGHPLGLVLGFSGRTLNYGASKYAYGFARVSFAIELCGGETLRFEMDERTRVGYEDGDFRLTSRGVQTRPEFEISTMSKGPIEGYFASEGLGELVGAKAGDKLIARTRVERKDGVLAYADGVTPPSKARAEIIACVFGENLAQFATLSVQEIQVVDSEEGGDD